MDTKSGYPFWVLANGLLPTYPRIKRDGRCDVAIIGGGITGALIADELSQHGHDVVVSVLFAMGSLYSFDRLERR